ncbi:ABC transporter substrate-binding protein [Actinocatenispora sera]|uniref:Sugar ABC transporter substrate-binding protein n=1 Tax=Actinocatenispora sera TaxID=390989 RepID=A0A810L637_9ACTN|nr:sugar ABC transporter substrate-binding protein [Actinocatenispora sera]BCJ30697.1 sugar ABC transporter substrate-binding protein [Actinocatenispora sera]
MRKPNGLSRRGVLAGAAGLVATGALAACGSNTGRGSSGGGSGPTIAQWYHQYGEAGVEQAVKRYAKAYSKANVQVQWTAGDYDTKLATALVGSGGPDVFEQSVAKVDQVRAHQLADLTDVFGAAKDDFTPAVLDAQTVDGKIYGIPQAIDMQMLFYRKSWLAKAGVSAPTTLAELASAAKKLTNKKVKGLFLGNDGGAGVLGAVPLWSIGQGYLSEDQRKVGFEAEAAAPVFAALRTMYSSGSLLLGAPADWSDPSAFTQGLTAMQWSGLWAVPVVQKALGNDFGVVAWPKGDDSGKPSVPIGAYASTVNAKSRHVDAAKAFAKWLWIDKTGYQRDFDLSYGFHIPARTSIAAKADKLSSGAGKDAVDLVQRYGKVQATPGWTSPMNTAYTDALNNIIRKGSNPESELKTAIGKIDKQLRTLYK